MSNDRKCDAARDLELLSLSMIARLVLACLLGLALAACRSAGVLPPERAILVLISIDAFRWDCLERFNPPVLSRLAAEGVRAEGLTPQFPSKTFPNHYTIVTGLTLAHHGIISNNMRAPDIPGEVSMSKRDVLADPPGTARRNVTCAGGQNTAVSRPAARTATTRAQSMQGLFIATGPRIRSGMTAARFENIHVYEFTCAVPGLQPAKNDGDPAVTRDMLR